jgi:hypothetical protein
MKNDLRLFLLVPTACVAIYACGDHEHAEVPATYDDVIYEGDTTDEALVALVSAIDQKTPAAVPSQAPTLDTPAAGALPKTPIPTFTWHVGAMAARTPAAPPVLFRVEAPSARAFFSPLAELVGPPRAVRAHGTPFTGTATWLVFSTDTNPKLARVLTGSTSYTPQQAVWDRMVAAKAPITLTLVGAVFADNRVVTDGGPFQGSKTTFTITP